MKDTDYVEYHVVVGDSFAEPHNSYTFYGCPKCGAIVCNITQHTRWHLDTVEVQIQK